MKWPRQGSSSYVFKHCRRSSFVPGAVQQESGLGVAAREKGRGDSS